MQGPRFARPALSLLAAVLISGCASSESRAGDAGISASPASFDDVTGAIAGYVFDEEQTPIAGAQVGLFRDGSAPEKGTATAADGSFSFSNLEPGPYRVIAQQLGFDPVSRSVDVAVAQATEVRLVLTRLTAAQAFHNTIPFKGFFDCSWTYAVVVGATGPCGFTNLNSTTGNPLEQFWTKNNRAWNYLVGPNMMTMLNEMTWRQGSLATGDRLAVSFSYANRTTAHWYCNTVAKNPLKLRWERDPEDPAKGSCPTGSQQLPSGQPVAVPVKGQMVRSYVNTGPGSAPATGTSLPVGLAYQQPFELWASAFYGAPANEGFTALPDT